MAAAESPVATGEPEIRTRAGRVRGRVSGGVAVFRGIPFASPPVGDLRFMAPRPPAAWDGVRDAADFGPAAPQAPPPYAPSAAAPAPGAGRQSAEWLTLNVWTPDLGAALRGGAAGLPVLVWVHGGAYLSGTGGDPVTDGTRFAAAGTVMVSCNYRLGVEGFAQIPGAPPNRGLLDLVAALRWVAENIANFGGDPGNVTVFGESAGAGAIAALLAMDAAKGLFRRAILQSIPGTFFTPDLAADITRAVAAEAGLAPTREALATAVPERLVNAQMTVTATMRQHPQWGPVAITDTPFSPVVDGEVLPRSPWRALLSGAARDVEILTGHNRDEYRLFIASSGRAGRITDIDAAEVLSLFAPGPPGPAAYREAHAGMSAERLYERVFSDWLFRMPSLHLAQAHAASGGRTFLYELTYPAPAAPETLGACHTLDVPLVFGTPPAALGLMMIGPHSPEDFAELGDRMRAEWITFASCGEPGWPAYGTQRRLTRIYDRPVTVDPYPEHVSMHLWERHRFDALGLPC